MRNFPHPEQEDNNNDVTDEEEEQQIQQQLIQQQQQESNNLSNTLKILPYQLLLNACQPLTSAFVSIKGKTNQNNNNSNINSNIRYYDQLLISRRSKYRAGIRFTRRGCDGSKRESVANFVQTEQICIVMNDNSDGDEYDGDKDGDEDEDTTEIHNNNDTIVELDKKDSTAISTTRTTNTQKPHKKRNIFPRPNSRFHTTTMVFPH